MNERLLGSAIGVAFVTLAMVRERAELQYKHAAYSDPLTGVGNRRAFMDSGQALLERYFTNYDARLASHFAAEPGRMRDRLLSYFAGWITQACQADSHGSCLAVKLAGEVCDLSEPMREALAVGMAQVCARLADAIARAAAEGSLAACADPAALADALYAMWLGAALRTKVMRDSSPLVRALADTEQRLAPPSR